MEIYPVSSNVEMNSKLPTVRTVWMIFLDFLVYFSYAVSKSLLNYLRHLKLRCL